VAVDVGAGELGAGELAGLGVGAGGAIGAEVAGGLVGVEITPGLRTRRSVAGGVGAGGVVAARALVGTSAG
jgi:hypothetical protein